MKTSSPDIAFDADALRDEEAALRREWLVTNGIGGYASATLAGANTRRYHGLLVAALRPPLGRAALLSKLEETLEVTTDGTGQAFALAANVYPDVIHPQGYRALESWSVYPAPQWVWSPAPGVCIEKRVWMEHGRNTTCIAYRLLEAPEGSVARLHLVPLLAWKDYHSEMRACDARVPAAWENAVLRLTLPGVWGVTEGPLPLTLYVRDRDGNAWEGAKFEARPDWYYRFRHPREQERGFEGEEDLYAPGTLSVPLAVGENLVIVATVEETAPEAPGLLFARLTGRQLNVRTRLWAEDACRKASKIPEESDPTTELLALAADAFRVQAPGGRATVIAGYPWFSDWGRDTMIALPGLCLAAGYPEVAREILLSFAPFVDQGMLPNRFPDAEEAPEYNAVDAALWYFHAVYSCWQATGDRALIDRLWPTLEESMQWHRQGTRYHIHVDAADGLLYAGEPGVQLTWMDAKIGDWVVTPRIGKPVEINALWHNALRVMAEFAGLREDKTAAAQYTRMAGQTAASFAARFPRPDGRGLYDVLDTPPDGQPDDSIRPNQVFAFSLPFAPLSPKTPLARATLRLIEEELVTPVGLRTLSPSDPAYRPRYEGDPRQRDSAYHQGTVWPWLLGPFAEAWWKVFDDAEGAREALRPLCAQLDRFGVGSLPEVYDGDAPHRPNGCIAQAWSVAETLRVWKLLL